MAKRRKRWGDPSLSFDQFVESFDEEAVWKVRDFAQHLMGSDTPGTNDLTHIFDAYIKGPEQVRDGIDRAFRWWTGYNFDTVVAQTFFGKDYEDVVDEWRRRMRRKP